MPYLLRFVALALVVGGCTCAAPEPPGTGRDGGPLPQRDGLPPGSCLTVTECGGRICDPATHMCVETLACTGHADCGTEAHCMGGTCVASETGSPCETDAQCIVGHSCTGGFCGCMGEAYGADSVPPNMLIVLDRSGSMQDMIPGGTKWEVALDSISSLLASDGDSIRFGLALYPGENQSCSMGMDCGPGTVFIDPPAPMPSDIDTFLAGANTCMFGTPTAEMLESLIGYPGLADTERPNYILLITDGQSTCDDPVPVAADILAQTPPVRTFVIGFGDGADPAELNALALAGDTARMGGPPHYYQADDPTELSDALSTIAGSVLTCTYTLDAEPADLNELYVYVDMMEVPRDTTHMDGWDYDPALMQITFYGPACDTLQGGSASDLAIVYGCPIILE